MSDRVIVVLPCISPGCTEHGSWGLNGRYACYAHRHLLEHRPDPPAPEKPKPKETPIGDLFSRKD